MVYIIIIMNSIILLLLLYRLMLAYVYGKLYSVYKPGREEKENRKLWADRLKNL